METTFVSCSLQEGASVRHWLEAPLTGDGATTIGDTTIGATTIGATTSGDTRQPLAPATH